MKDKQRSTLPVKDKHTPGPWWVSESGSIEFEDGYIGEAYDFNGTDKTDLPMMANARLMAAAPMMLDELISARHALELASMIVPERAANQFVNQSKHLGRMIKSIKGDNCQTTDQ